MQEQNIILNETSSEQSEYEYQPVFNRKATPMPKNAQLSISEVDPEEEKQSQL